MDERTFFAASAAVGLMQFVEACLLLSRAGRLSSIMCLSSAVEATWFGASIYGLCFGWVSGARVVWPAAFALYFVLFAVLSRRIQVPGREAVPDEDPPRLDNIELPLAFVVAAMCFSATYALGCYMTYRGL